MKYLSQLKYKKLCIHYFIHRASSSYNYICENPQKKNAKRYRNPDGSVKTKPRNICSNSEFKLDHERSKTFKYSFSDFDTQKKIRNVNFYQNVEINYDQH